jgi:hypothetical protein
MDDNFLSKTFAFLLPNGEGLCNYWFPFLEDNHDLEKLIEVIFESMLEEDSTHG